MFSLSVLELAAGGRSSWSLLGSRMCQQAGWELRFQLGWTRAACLQQFCSMLQASLGKSKHVLRAMVFFKPLHAEHVLINHWPKQVTWFNLNPGKGKISYSHNGWPLQSLFLFVFATICASGRWMIDSVNELYLRNGGWVTNNIGRKQSVSLEAK